MKIYLVGGTFDGENGKASGVITKIGEALEKESKVKELVVYNGGNISEILRLYGENGMEDADVIMWFVNVPNEYEKNRDIKSKYPRKLLVTSKRNHNEYSFNYLVNHALGMKANLTVEFSRGENGKFQSMLFDPLGAVWVDNTYDLGVLAGGLVERLDYLRTVKRVGTIHKEGIVELPDETEFVTLVKELSDTFHELIHPAEGVNRFLGNASFRCRHGFPSFRGENQIFVTRRNIDKRDLGMEGFVPVERGENNEVIYYGEFKPSVDTPIQLALYEHYPNVKYMVHSHVYLKDAPFTEVAVPCGGMQEVDEITKLFPNKEITDVVVNLIGHGSLILASSVDKVKEKIENYIERPTPEVMRTK